MNLSLNLNKIALLRNSRGSGTPSLEGYANESIKFGVDGLTLHPRPDHRHATSEDAIKLSFICNHHNLEFNLEGNPFSIASGEYLGFQEICYQANPHQITLVPDSPLQITSDHGWQKGFKDKELKQFINNHKRNKIRISLFINADIESVEYAADMGVDRVELYTGPFAEIYASSMVRNTSEHIEIKNIMIKTIQRARELNLGVNAGHDLNLANLPELMQCGSIDEVSIGHAIIIDSLKYGFYDTIMKYKEITKGK
jgi:pyridoxine 5-phosphate synthase|tara:strand:+ start:165 stop:929 length:765 start_codon:yes stop_codon:yes gene_type:complete